MNLPLLELRNKIMSQKNKNFFENFSLMINTKFILLEFINYNKFILTKKKSCILNEALIKIISDILFLTTNLKDMRLQLM